MSIIFYHEIIYKGWPFPNHIPAPAAAPLLPLFEQAPSVYTITSFFSLNANDFSKNFKLLSVYIFKTLIQYIITLLI